MSYDDAARALFQVPHGEFVAERKRLAAELKAAGDKNGASRISRLQRPPVTAWAVNQLYWHARDAVDALFDLAARLRAGDLSATTAHREALAKLRTRAAAMLGDAGHGANEATLRRIALTLSAVAAAGSWMPDAPGQLSADRDPPGFDAVGVIVAPAAPLPTKTDPVKYDFDAPIAPIVVAATPPPPAPAAPKRNALAELAAKRKAMAEEEKRRKAAEKRGEVYVPLSEEDTPTATPVAPTTPIAPTTSAASAASAASITPIRPRPASVPPSAPIETDESDEDDDDEEVIEPPPRPRTLSIVPPLPPDKDKDEDEDVDTATASDESDDDDNADDDESDDDGDGDDNADDVEAPASAAPKLSALEQLRLRKKQQAEEAEEERRRKFMEDGGTRDRVIAKRMMEAQERNRDTADTKRERVDAAVRAKLDAQRGSTVESDDDDDEIEDDDTSAPTLTVERGGRADSPSKGPPQATDLVNALAAKLGAKPPDASAPKLSTGASPPRGTTPTPATPASTKLSTGASPPRHVPENTKPPGTFPRPRTPSPSNLATPTASNIATPTAKPGANLATPTTKLAITDAERRKIDARAKLKAELETRLRSANAEVLAAEQRVEKLTAELADADDALEAARAVVEDLRDKLDAID